MTRERTRKTATTPTGPDREACVPPGAPSWVTVELIAQTLRVWQPYYPQQLIPEDALDMILNVGRIVQVLQRGDDDEAVRSTGPSKQS